MPGCYLSRLKNNLLPQTLISSKKKKNVIKVFFFLHLMTKSTVIYITVHGQKSLNTLTPHLYVLDEHFILSLSTIYCCNQFCSSWKGFEPGWSCDVCGTQINYYINDVPQIYIRHCM